MLYTINNVNIAIILLIIVIILLVINILYIFLRNPEWNSKNDSDLTIETQFVDNGNINQTNITQPTNQPTNLATCPYIHVCHPIILL